MAEVDSTSVTKRTISIIIITYKRPQSLKRCLRALTKQTLRRKWIETLVIYDPTDPYSKDIERFAEIFDVRLVPCSQKGVANNRNYGARFAKGEILGFIDDDSIPSPKWAEEIIKGFINPNVGMTGGRIIKRRNNLSRYNSFLLDNLNYATTMGKVGGIIFSKRLQSLKFSSRYDEITNSIEIDTPMGCNMAVRSDLFREVGGFESMPYREETELAIRLRRRGWKVIYLPNASVVHTWEESGGVRSFRSILLSNGYRATALIYKKHFWDGQVTSLLRFILLTPLPSKKMIVEAWDKGVFFLMLRMLATIRGFVSLLIGVSS